MLMNQMDGLPQMDEGFFGGKCDPYLKITFAGITLKNKHKTVFFLAFFFFFSFLQCANSLRYVFLCII